MTRRRLCARLLASVVALVLLAGSATKVQAHATLQGTEPADGATLARPPSEIVLRFNEPVAPVALRVIDPRGKAVAASDLKAEGPTLRATLPAGLEQGSYLVSYRVVSADAHPIGGAFAFAVGAPTDAPARGEAAAGDDAVWLGLKIVLRALQDIGLMVAAGGVLFQALVLRREPPVPGTRAPIIAGAALAGTAAVLGIGVQGGLLVAGPPSVILDPQAWRLGAGSGLGTAALAAVGGMALVVAGAMGRIPAWIAALAGAGSCMSLALTGHAAAAGVPAQVAMALHAVAAAYWMGSLWPLYRLVRSRPAADAARLVRQFSATALVAVALLAAAGLMVALSRIDAPSQLIATTYGRLLAAKLLLVAGLLGLAALNRYRRTPALAAGAPNAGPVLARSVGRGMMLGVCVLAVTALLAHTPPPSAPAAPSVRQEGAPGAAASYSAVAFDRAHSLVLELAPARTGTNDLMLQLSHPDGSPLEPREVAVTLALPAAGLEPLARPAAATGDGGFRASGLVLPVAGEWRLRVDALISDFEQLSFEATLPVHQPDGARR